jgi:16S rRNA (guanine966-N2)-methyltransferase
MRVVAGEAKGRRLVAPAGRATRPTSDRVREAVFSSLGSLGGVEGAAVVDLFAGSGALGIEALSRGAAHAIFVEQDRQATVTIRANLAATGLADRATVVGDDVLRWVGAQRERRVDLVLCDPPYAFDQWPVLLAGLYPLTSMIVVETGADLDLDLGSGWEILRAKRYGGTVVTVARPADPPAAPANRKGDT